MSKIVITISALAAAAIGVALGTVYLTSDQDAASARFDRGPAGTILFLPVKPRPEERILRHPHADGSADDDVVMRDGTTKHIVYDAKMTLRQVAAYYKGAKDQDHGPLMYEKTHNAEGHLALERHLRTDGSLEMDGRFRLDGTYLRHLYYPPVTPSATSAASVASGDATAGGAANAGSAAKADPAKPASASAPESGPANAPAAPNLVVSAEQTFDKWWHPVSETDYRLDATRKSTHTWGDGLDETVSNFSDDGTTMLTQVTTGRGKYYTAIYYPDGLNIKVEALNTYEGTTFQWYRPDHTLQLKLTYTAVHSDEFVIPDAQGKPQVKQVWFLDYSGQPVDGKYPKRLDHLDHLNAEGNTDIRYEFDSTGTKVTTATVYLGDTELGARLIYTVGDDGWAVSVKTFDENNNDHGGKPLTHADGKQFVLEPWMTNRPTYELPPLKDGLNLYGTQRYFGWGGR
jgi:hypothetical protein